LLKPIDLVVDKNIVVEMTAVHDHLSVENNAMKDAMITEENIVITQMKDVRNVLRIVPNNLLLMMKDNKIYVCVC
jgi:hypothetical protein